MSIQDEIIANINGNGQQKITGPVLQKTLLDMVSANSGDTANGPDYSVQIASGGTFYGDSGFTYVPQVGTQPGSVNTGTLTDINLYTSRTIGFNAADPVWRMSKQVIGMGNGVTISADALKITIPSNPNVLESNGFAISQSNYQRNIFEVNQYGSVWMQGYIKDSNNKYSISPNYRYLSDSYNTTSLNWGNRVSYDYSRTRSFSWQSRNLYDTSSSSSLNWGNRQLDCSSGNTTVDWQNTKLQSPYDSINYLTWGNTTLPTQATDIVPLAYLQTQLAGYQPSNSTNGIQVVGPAMPPVITTFNVLTGFLNTSVMVSGGTGTYTSISLPTGTNAQNGMVVTISSNQSSYFSATTFSPAPITFNVDAASSHGITKRFVYYESTTSWYQIN